MWYVRVTHPSGTEVFAVAVKDEVPTVGQVLEASLAGWRAIDLPYPGLQRPTPRSGTDA